MIIITIGRFQNKNCTNIIVIIGPFFFFKIAVIFLFGCPVSEFIEFKPRLKSPKNRFQLSVVLYLEKFNTMLSGTNQI